MGTIRTDLAVEAHELWQQSSAATTALSGVRAREDTMEGLPLHRVDILDDEGVQALGKPQGTYLTLDITAFWTHEADGFSRVTRAIAALLAPLLPEEGSVLVAGIGNRAMTPDALGPCTLAHLLITRHLGKILPDFRSVAALGAGVLGTTGMEVAEWVRGAAQRVSPAAVIVIDALAARSLDRLCSSVQIADSGLIPGSGVGNHRMALCRDTLGVPVISMGVPTVVDAATLVRDLTGQEDALHNRPAFFVTPDSIDEKIQRLAKILGYGMNLAFHSGLTLEDISVLLE